LTALGHDLRSGVRLLSRWPGFAAVVVLTLGLGIGANTAIFGAVQAVLLRRLPYPSADRLMFVSRAYPGFPQGGGNFSYPAAADIARMNRSFDVFAVYQAYGPLTLTEGPEPIRVTVNYVTPSYLGLLGLTPAMGRTFLPQEDRYEDADPVLVISRDFWRRQLGGARDVVGQRLVLNGRTFTVVGVAPAEFRDAPAEQELGQPIDAWVPLGLAHRILGQFGPNDRAGAIFWGIGRRRPDVTVEQARADVAAIGERLGQMYPETDRGFGLVARPLKDQLLGLLYAPVRLLAAGAAFILLIGCANAANLLLARLVTRQRELAVRLAHGATRGHLIAQVVVENLVLALAAGALGSLLAVWILAALRRSVEAGLPPVVHFSLTGGLLLGSVALTLATGLIFGLVPAVLGSRVPLAEALNAGGRQGGSGVRRSAARVLVACEVGLALVLLSGAGLLGKSLSNLTSADLGFRTNNLLTMRLDLRSERYSTEEGRARFAKSLIQELEPLPGVESVTLWGPSMLGRATWVLEAVREGVAADDPSNIVMSARHSVNPGALGNLGIALRSGRDFTWSDDARAPLVAIVSESTARTQWPGEDPIGKRFRTMRIPGWFTVVGVAADARHRQRIDLTDAANGIAPEGLGPQRDVYLPYAQRPNPALVVAVRTSREVAMATRALRGAVRRMDPALPLYDVALLDERLAGQEVGSRVLTIVAGLYAGVALFLASLGLYGVLAHSVERRTQEIGIRRALGAPPASVLRLVVAEGLTPTLVGIGAGLLAAFLVTRGIASLLYGVGATDPGVFCGIIGLLLGVAAAACWLPARRAIRVDPIVALRAP